MAALNGFKGLESTAIPCEQNGGCLHLNVWISRSDALTSAVHWVLSCFPE